MMSLSAHIMVGVIIRTALAREFREPRLHDLALRLRKTVEQGINGHRVHRGAVSEGMGPRAPFSEADVGGLPSGLTIGPLAGRLLADQVLGRETTMDLRPYDPLRKA